jgi:hypothetical protein
MADLVPGPLAVFHRLFIGVALVATVVYGGWELREWTRGAGDARALARAGLAFAVALAMAAYLWSRRPPAGRPRRAERS